MLGHFPDDLVVAGNEECFWRSARCVRGIFFWRKINFEFPFRVFCAGGAFTPMKIGLRGIYRDCFGRDRREQTDLDILRAQNGRHEEKTNCE